MLWKASETFSIFRKIEEKPCVATQTCPKVKVVRCRHTGLKVKTVRCRHTGPKGFKRNPLESCVFLVGSSRLRRGGMDMFQWTL